VDEDREDTGKLNRQFEKFRAWVFEKVWQLCNPTFSNTHIRKHKKRAHILNHKYPYCYRSITAAAISTIGLYEQQQQYRKIQP
jgi:hypothetical protein